MPRHAKGVSQGTITRGGPGRYGDGCGLYLNVKSKMVKHWSFRYVRNGRMREMGLGAAIGRDAVSLSDARQKARELWAIHQAGRDPLAERRAGRMAVMAASVGSGRSFRQAAEEFIELNRAGWRNGRHALQWETTLAEYAYPVIGALSVDTITTAHVAAVLTPIWTSKPVTASRVRGRIEQVLGREKGLGHRSGENPAAWKHNLDAVLPKPAKVKAPVQHLAAMPASELGDFMARLRDEPGVPAHALEFAILAAARTGEVLQATWGEIDFEERLWTVPAERMKGGREHRVPLAPRSIEILRTMTKGTQQDDAFVFPGSRPGAPLTAGALLQQMKDMGVTDASVHGMRSTFRDWVSESTNFAGEVAELALAHNVGDATERSYRRGDQLAKRFALAEAWAAFCAKPSVKDSGDKVVPIRGGVK
jgi:integrase